MAASHRVRRSLAVVACLILSALLAGSLPAGTLTRRSVRVLQMNLCDSGIAGCYTGHSVARAAALIRAQIPDLVTVDEVCRHDVYVLYRALAGVFRDGRVVWAFKAAADRRTGGPTLCRNGQPYGIGLVAHIPAPPGGYTVYSGIYPSQDAVDPEERAWLCVDARAGLYACATHLDSTTPAVALAQCRYLLDTAVPAVRRRDGYGPTVIGGDLNLRYGRSPDVRSCVRAGLLRQDDGAVQQIVATGDCAVSWARSIGMDGTTDHPALLVSLAIPAAVRPPPHRP